MESNKYMHMLKLGEWLERLYAPDLEGWKMRGLAEEAIKLLGIAFDIRKDEIILSDFEAHEDKFKMLLQIPIEEYDSKMNKFSLKLPSNISTKNLSVGWGGVLDSYFYAFYTRISSLNIFKYLMSSKKPWQISFDGYREDFLVTWMHRICNEFYGLLTITYIHTPENGFNKIRTFQDQTAVTYSIDGALLGEGFGYIFPWHIVISRIVIEFLEYGGQNYYGFCERCGKFYLVQRKGRKQYCSHICRSYSSLIRAGKIKPKQ